MLRRRPRQQWGHGCGAPAACPSALQAVVQDSTAQHSTAQHSRTQQDTAGLSTVQRGAAFWRQAMGGWCMGTATHAAQLSTAQPNAGQAWSKHSFLHFYQSSGLVQAANVEHAAQVCLHLTLGSGYSLMVTRLAWMAHRLQSSNRCTAKSSVACRSQHHDSSTTACLYDVATACMVLCRYLQHRTVMALFGGAGRGSVDNEQHNMSAPSVCRRSCGKQRAQAQHRQGPVWMPWKAGRAAVAFRHHCCPQGSHGERACDCGCGQKNVVIPVTVGPARTSCRASRASAVHLKGSGAIWLPISRTCRHAGQGRVGKCAAARRAGSVDETIKVPRDCAVREKGACVVWKMHVCVPSWIWSAGVAYAETCVRNMAMRRACGLHACMHMQHPAWHAGLDRVQGY
jgi:hypothetical protein